MKLHYAIPAALGILTFSVLQAQAVDVRAPGVAVQSGPNGTSVVVGTPNVGVNIQAPAAPVAGVVRPEASRFTDNRPDPWRYQWASNRWWYWTPENRWMTYADPGGWTYYQPSGSYTAAYDGVTVAPSTTDVTPPATTYSYPNSTYYYGNPGYYYYGRPGIYVGRGGWGYGYGRRYR